jgi:hypothetical protein
MLPIQLNIFKYKSKLGQHNDKIAMQAKKGICRTRVNNFVRVVCKMLRDVQNHLPLLNSHQQKMWWMLFS